MFETCWIARQDQVFFPRFSRADMCVPRRSVVGKKKRPDGRHLHFVYDHNMNVELYAAHSFHHGNKQ